jgi:3'-phosphoadenosine 5'-phosphosulfate sulfotransferase (PAPS reductase)/FAD synthetase
MIDLAEKKKRFPSSQTRFCTSELKSIPFIDYVLEQKEHLIIVQGIRAGESHNRAQMSQQCRYFKYYFEPYNDKGKKHTYRKKDIIKWCEKYTDDIIRPVFDWTGQQVIDYIIEKGQQPNPLYKQGFKRVGCFPCIMSGHKEVYEILKRYPERFEEILEHEKRIGSSFFKIDFVPYYARSGICYRTSIKFTTGEDVKRYLQRKNQTLDLFADDSPISCSSYYHLCE